MNDATFLNLVFFVHQSSRNKSTFSRHHILLREAALLEVVLGDPAEVWVGAGSVPALWDVARVAADGRHAVLAHALAAGARLGQLLQAEHLPVAQQLPLLAVRDAVGRAAGGAAEGLRRNLMWTCLVSVCG